MVWFVCAAAIFCIAVSGCAVGQDYENLPIDETPGTISSAELIKIFEASCVKNFPDMEATRAAFRQAGMVITDADTGLDEPTWDVVNAAQGIEGTFGHATVFDLGTFNICQVRAFVTEPESVDVQILPAGLTIQGPSFSGYFGTTSFPVAAGDGRPVQFEVSLPELLVTWSTDKGHRRVRQPLELTLQAETVEQ